MSLVAGITLIGAGMEIAYLSSMIGMNNEPLVEKRVAEALKSKKNETGVVKPKIVEGKEGEKELNKANDKINNICKFEFDTIQSAAKRMGINPFELTKKYNATKKWINYAVYFMTHSNSNIIKTDDETELFVNAVSNMAGYGPIYDDAGVGDINMYDIINPNYNPDEKFALCLDSLKSELKDASFKLYMSNTKDIRAISTSKEIGDIPKIKPEDMHSINDLDKPYKPFTTTNDQSADFKFNSKGFGISDELFERLEKSFGKFLKGNKNYQYSIKNNGMIKLTVAYPNYFREFDIDNGSAFGGTNMRIKCNFFTDQGAFWLFVDPEKAPKTVGVLFSSEQPITGMENQLRDLLNPEVYTFIDFSDTAWFDNLSQSEKAELDTKLCYAVSDLRTIMNASFGDVDINLYPRFRFNNFKSVKDFELISDDKVKCTIKDTTDYAATNVTDNISYRIHGDNVIGTFNGNSKEIFHYEEQVTGTNEQQN